MSERQEHEPGLEQRAKALFDASTERLDGRVRSRLTQARFRALAELDRRPGAGARQAWLPAGAAVAALAAAVWWWHGPPVAEPELDVAALDDFELLLGEGELEMIEELEFYAWLGEQPDFTPPAAGEDGVG